MSAEVEETDQPVITIRKKPVELSALRFTGENLEQALRFTERSGTRAQHDHEGIVIQSTKGTLTARPGSWLVVDTNGEVLPISPKTFTEKWEILAETNPLQ